MNADRIAHAYYGDLTHPSTERCRRRIHWMCEQAVGTRVLDIGCSEGIVGLILGREGYSYTGVDLEDAALAYARQAAAKESELVRTRLQFRTADATTLPFEDGSFDTVMIGEVLEHLTHPERVVLEARRVLAPNGRLVITVPLGRTHDHPDHKRVFYPSSLVRVTSPYFETLSIAVQDTYVLYTGDIRSAGAAVPDHARDQAGVLRQLEEHCMGVEAERGRLRLFTGNLKRELKEARRRLSFVDTLERRVHDAEAALAAHQGALARAELTVQQLDAALRDKDRQQVAAIRALEETYAKKLRDQDRAHKTAAARAAENRRSDEAADRLRQLAAAAPPGAVVLVVSKGDEQLVTLRGRAGLHFPQDGGGAYAGFHPLDSAWAIAHLEALKGRGATHLLFPAAAFWWLTHYVELREHLTACCTAVAYEPEVGLLLHLGEEAQGTTALPSDTVARAAATFGKPLSPPAGLVQATTAAAKPAPVPTPSAPAPTASSAASNPSKPAANATTTATPGLPAMVSDTAVLEPQPRRDGSDPPTVAAILDRFTTSCLQPEARLVTFRPDNWRETLERHRPDVVFVESAWQGNDGAWKYRVASYQSNMGDELLDLVAWARRRDIPTVFWNKEDPVHFERFIERGRAFDFVFTTDANCVPRYRDQLGHDRVFALPFAAQPNLHNPIQTESRRGSVCFAGTYYGSRHDERRRDLAHVLKPALGYGLDIYDRQAGAGSSDADSYRFPDEYEPALRGRLEYDEMVKAYKRYRVFLNVNSVKDSPTMFSRRVFELLASGTPVVSSYARGLVAMLDDAVFISESETDTRRHLETLLNDEEAWARASVRGIRRVLAEHTYRRRLAGVWQQIGLDTSADRPPTMTVVAQVRSSLGARRLAEALRGQSLPPHDVVVVGRKAVKEASLGWWRSQLPDVPVEVVPHNGEVWQHAVARSSADFVAVMDDRDYYGREYLRDHALAMDYASCDFVGKQAFQRRDGRSTVTRVTPGTEFRTTRQVPSATLVARRPACTADVLHAALGSRVFSRPQDEILSIDWFNYVQDAHVVHGGAFPMDARLLSHVEA